MSKETTIRCNACGKQATGTGYSTLWARLKKMAAGMGAQHALLF